MMIRLSKKVLATGLCIVAVTAVACTIVSFYSGGRDTVMVLGGELKELTFLKSVSAIPANMSEDSNASERFQRPSNRQALESPFSYEDVATIPPKVYTSPKDVLYAYFTILQQASNMNGYTGGCGTVGQAELPYPFAYALLSGERHSQVTQQKFTGSFRGIGHLTFLTLEKAYRPINTPDDIEYWMVEIEAIQGWPEQEAEKRETNFTYYYGLATLRNQPQQGWKIDSLDYLTEDFLCAPYHGWSWDATAVVQIVYQENLQLVTQIDKVEQNGINISIYASGGEEYRFDFVRLTNGCDLLLHEYIREGEEWKETDLLGDTWGGLKFSLHSFAQDS